MQYGKRVEDCASTDVRADALCFVVGDSEKLALSPRRCISKELLDQMPMLSVSVSATTRSDDTLARFRAITRMLAPCSQCFKQTRYHEVTIAKPFGVFHLMQLIEKSIQVGALFSPKLYVPKEIW